MIRDQRGSSLGAFWVGIVSIIVLAQWTAPLSAQVVLYAPDWSEGDFFGRSVATWQDWVVVGASGNDALGPSSGAVYSYLKVDGTWYFDAKLAPEGLADSWDRFGNSLDLEGSLLTVGASNDSTHAIGSGAGYIYRNHPSGWVLEAKAFPSTPSSDGKFGFSTAAGKDIAIFGAHNDHHCGSNCGAVFVYEKIAGTWAQTAKLTSNDARSNDIFGLSVALDGTTLVVGAPGDKTSHATSHLGTWAGSVYIFEKEGGQWLQKQKIRATPLGHYDHYGWDVALHGDYLVVGTGDADDVYLYKRTPTGWTLSTKIGHPTGGGDFGAEVAIHGNDVVIGPAIFEQGPGFAYSYKIVDDQLRFVSTLTPNGGESGFNFGASLAIGAQHLVVGSDGALDEVGLAFAYPNEIGIFADGFESGDLFAWSGNP